MGDKRKTPAIYCATHWEVRRGTVGLEKLNKRLKKGRKKNIHCRKIITVHLQRNCGTCTIKQKCKFQNKLESKCYIFFSSALNAHMIEETSALPV